jgi:glycosyltransferase involved in cell wall biosynthesis
MSKKLKILIVAHEFSPSQGSECAVGWNLVTHLSKYHNITVLYASRNQFNTSDYESSVNRYLEANGKMTGLNLIPIDQPDITKFIVKINLLIRSTNSAIGFAPLYYAGYRFWQKSAYRIARDIVRRDRFDIVHQLTSISFREPGFLWKLDIPFVWGPVSGLVKIPSTYYKNLNIKEILFELVRRSSNFIQSNFSYRIKNAAVNAKLIFAVAPDDYSFFLKHSKALVLPLLDVGTYDHLIGKKSMVEKSQENTTKLKLLWIGRLVHTKALELLLFAMDLDKNLQKNTEITIIGDGPLFNKYRNIEEKLGIKNIKWMGSVSHERVFEVISTYDALIHTSIKEATSAVILEALSCGLPVICHDAFGMGIAIDDRCGIKVQMDTPEKSIKGFSEAIRLLDEDRDLLKNLSQGALKRAEELSWDSIAQQIAFEYNRVAGFSNEIK